MKHCTTRCKNFEIETIENLIAKYLGYAQCYYKDEQTLKNNLMLDKTNDWYIRYHEFWEDKLQEAVKLKRRNLRRAGRLLIEYTKRIDGRL